LRKEPAGKLAGSVKRGGILDKLRRDASGFFTLPQAESYKTVGGRRTAHYDDALYLLECPVMRDQSLVSIGLSFTRMFLIWIVLSTSAWAESPDEVLMTMLDEFLAGASRNDVAAHERFWSDDLVYTSSTGARFGKAEIIGPMQEGAESAGDQNDDEETMVYGREALLVRVYGDAAVLTFRLVGTQQAEPKTISKYYNTGTFLLRDGEWRAIAWQATRIPDET
jgi:hypothetical protein